MNNEIGRKITSLTLMTIMLVGGMVIAAPGMVPEAAAANTTLFVSAENSTYNNTFGGPQIVEIVVSNTDIAALDTAYGLPDVTVNGKDVVMAQGSDGSWYAYVADVTQADLADADANFDFGIKCTVAEADDIGVFFGAAATLFSETQGVYTNADACTTGHSAATTQNVLEGTKSLGTGALGAGALGQADLVANVWPLIQLYNFNPTGSVVIEYNKAGGSEISTLTFDTTTDLVIIDSDRTFVPQGAQVHIGIGDPQLNIDPTSEDAWFFDIVDGGAHYGDQSSPSVPITGTDAALSTMMFESNGVLKLTTNGVLEIDAANNDTNPDSAQVGIYETGANTSYFTTYDDSDDSIIQVKSTAPRGTAGTIDYNGSATSYVASNYFATLDMDATSIGDEWNSGESITVNLADEDLNKNSRADEDLDLYSASFTNIPSLQIGSPFTLDEADTFIFYTELNNGDTTFNTAEDLVSISTVAAETQEITAANVTVDAFSKRAMINDSSSPVTLDLDSTGEPLGTAVSGSALVIGFTGRDVADLKAVIEYPAEFSATPLVDTFDGFNYLNYDIRTFNENQATGSHAVIQTDIYLIVGDDAADTIDGTLMINANVAEYCLIDIAQDQAMQGLVQLSNEFHDILYTDDANGTACNGGAIIDADSRIGLLFLLDDLDTGAVGLGTKTQSIVADFVSFGDRANNAIYRMELEETGDNTSVFTGSVEYIMLNQLNANNQATFGDITTISGDIIIIVTEDLTDEDGPRVNYLDLGADGVSTQIADQQDAPSHSGIVSLDMDNYKVADTVVVTLIDMDLNVDSSLIDVYTSVATGQVDDDILATSTHLLDITFNDALWDGLEGTGFTLVETGPSSGTFTGSFQVPSTVNTSAYAAGTILTGGAATAMLLNTDTPTHVRGTFATDDVITVTDLDGTTATITLIAGDITAGELNNTFGDSAADFAASTDGSIAGFVAGEFVSIELSTTTSVTSTGTDIEVNYNDHRDASGETIEVGDGAGIRANTGSISLDRTVYPVPWGLNTDFATITSGKTPNSFSLFPVHATGITSVIDDAAEQIKTTGGDLTIHIRVNDADLDVSAVGEDKMNEDRAGQTVGPIKITLSRGNADMTLAYAGGDAASTDRGIVVGSDSGFAARTMGPINEVAGDTGIFELDFTIRYTDGPASILCPDTTTYTSLDGDSAVVVGDRFKKAANADDDSLTAGQDFCVLQGDILTVEYTDSTDASGNVNTVTDSATFDLRNGVLQSDKSVYIIGGDMILTIIEPDWDLDNDGAESYDLDVIQWDSSAQTTTLGSTSAFDPEPSKFRETGDSTGIFQVVIEIPDTLDGTLLDRGEQIDLEYTDWGPSGANYVGAEDEDIGVTVYTSNFGATIELDQKVYTWTDKVYITIVAPDHNFDSNLVDTIGDTADDSVKISTRSFDTDKYSLVETGTDTGIFTGEIILTGFTHDADGTNTHTPTSTSGDDKGPTDGFLETSSDDGLTVSFEYSSDATVVGSALIRWNIGEVQFLEASYPASGTGVVRVIDPDMNLNPEAVDNFSIDTWSDSDAGGISLTVTETNEATGIFEGTVFFTTTNESSGHRLRVAEGDTVTAEYEDNTLPDPYTTADELDVSATTLIGTVVPPLERAPAANLRTVDAFGNSLDAVSVDQQVQISADLANGQDREQAFAYLVQIQDGNGVTVSLAWITGQLSSGQSFSPALSWIPTEAGTYTATAFVWESIDNPTALSPPVSTTISVS